MPFIANTDQQQKQMLGDIGMSMDDLFSDIPSQLLAKSLELPDGIRCPVRSLVYDNNDFIYQA